MAAALSFCLGEPAIAVALIGTTDVRHLGYTCTWVDLSDNGLAAIPAAAEVKCDL